MQTVFNIIMLLCILAIPSLHILSAVFKSCAKVFSLFCLSLHIVSLLPLIYFGAELELIFMLYMISLAVRQISFLAFGKRGG